MAQVAQPLRDLLKAVLSDSGYKDWWDRANRLFSELPIDMLDKDTLIITFKLNEKHYVGLLVDDKDVIFFRENGTWEIARI